jgi:hypothetical protein
LPFPRWKFHVILFVAPKPTEDNTGQSISCDNSINKIRFGCNIDQLSQVHGQIINLMQALKQSIEKTRPKRKVTPAQGKRKTAS